LKRNQLSKLAYGFQKTKESITQNIVSDLIGRIVLLFRMETIVSTAAPFILKTIPFIKNWFTKEKRQLLF
jgi:hypothetical protein